MSVRVKGGTPLHGESLCQSCTRAHIVRGYRETEELVICQGTYPERRMLFPVRDCTGYVSITSQVLGEMQKIAWVLAPRGPKRRAGFLPLNEWCQGDEDEDTDSEFALNPSK